VKFAPKRSATNQQQNGQCQKGPQQNGLHQSGRAIKLCTPDYATNRYAINRIIFLATIGSGLGFMIFM